MGGLATEFDGERELTIAYHTEHDDARGESVLTGVVAWRRGRATTHGWRALARRMQWRLGLTPLQRQWSIGRESGLWYGSAGEDGEQMTLFHPIRRVVRVLGHEHPLPPYGRTIVLLVDERGEAPRVAERSIPTPRVLHSESSPTSSLGEFRFPLDSRVQQAWRAALQVDPEIAAFLKRVRD